MTKDLIITENPKSRFAESIKTIRTNLAFANVDSGLKVILNTSPEMGDGKSFISANLALAFAQDNKKVLLIDCDLRLGRQHKIFGVENSSKGGYANLILNFRSDTRLNAYIKRTAFKNLHVLPIGITPPNPVEILASNNNQLLLEKLKNIYDIIILDCPPVLGLSDTMILTKYSDANMVTVSIKKTKYEAIEQVKKEFAKAKAKITGVVVNKDRTKGKSYYGYGYYTEDNKKTKYKKEDIPTVDFEEEKIGNKKQNNVAVTSSVVSSIVKNSK